MDRIQFLIIDDHPLVRRGIRAALSEQPGFEVVAAVGTLAEGIHALIQHHVDIAIVDLGLPDGSGLEFIARSVQESPRTKVIVSSMRDERVFAHRCIAAGARGYVAKQQTETVLLKAIAEVMKGRVFLSESGSELASEGDHSSGTDGKHMTPQMPNAEHGLGQGSLSRLSNRELTVFELIGMGYSTKTIAEKMGVKSKTIDSFRERIKNKLELKSSSELLTFATRWLLSFEEG